ncbi:MAG: lysine--tRNA ligase [Patescibacteria group bacterium]|jgi:lysyl-tRNA synthetase class 2|nr:lysine--tRNA ligase [Patescibacteria group bacterium]
MSDEKISEIEERKNKLDQIRKLGINPYVSNNNKTHSINEVLLDFDKNIKNSKVFVVGGRLKTNRTHGNLTFSNIEDSSGNIQIALSKKALGDDSYKHFVKLIDMGDFIEVKGTCFLTHKNEKSLMVNEWRLLSKTIRPLPEKYHGLKDEDKKQRFRELEMVSDRNAFDRFRKRFEATRIIREFMWKHKFIEVETPILQNVYGGTYAKPFTTYYHGLDQDFYLRIAPEMFLKRTITGGFERIFEIGKCFRNEGMSPAHLQEFTMFEFYWPYVDYNFLMDFTENLVSEVVEKVYKNYVVKYGDNEINFKPPYPRKTFDDLLKENLGAGIDGFDTEEKIEKYVSENKLENIVHLSEKVGWPAKIDELYKKTIRNKLINPIFVTDYPKELMALAKTKEDDPKKVATFQLVINTWEMIKAYNELNDPIDQRERFEAQERLVIEGDEEAMPFDHDFVESMEYGMPPMAGWGMGLDRFFALLEGEENIRDMVLFPTMKRLNELKVKSKKLKDDGVSIDLGIDYNKAQEIFNKYLNEENTKLHSLESEAIMRGLAKHFGEDEEQWGIIGLLHDIDWDETREDIANHTVRAVDILKNEGASDYLINTIVSHGFGDNGCGLIKENKRNSRVEHALASAETLTGLIIASAKMQPDKKLASVKLSSLKKKFKQKAFAANCNREIISECEKIGLSTDEFLEIGLNSLQEISDKLRL